MKNMKYAKWEEYKKTLTKEQYKALLWEGLNDKKKRLETEMKCKVKEYKKLKREMRECNEAILMLGGDVEAFLEGA